MSQWIPQPFDASYWEASPVFRQLCRRKLSDEAWSSAQPRLAGMGATASRVVAPLAAVADREPPRLVTHDAVGNRVDRIEFHPAYREMERVAYGSGMVAMNYGADRSSDSRVAGFALGYLFAMAESGLYCPLCMTDGVARVLTKFGTTEQIDRVVPHLTSTDVSTLWTGGMFLTERSGGSDVGANETIARRVNGEWRLSGDKWFCSNVGAEAVLVTARPEGEKSGTAGLRTFLVLPHATKGVRIERLKPKLGVRSMPTGEVTFDGAVAEEVGGFSAIAEMLNLSRLYNSVAAVAVAGRAVLEARNYIEQRQVFGRPVVEWPLAQETLFDAKAEHAAALLLTFETVDMLQRADAGDAEAAALLRFLTPLVKLSTAKMAVPIVSEAIELIGGNAYIEESPMPRLLRDAQVLPIWEGTTNVLLLDALRVALKHGTHEVVLARVRRHFPRDADALAYTFASLDERDARCWMDRLIRMFQLALLVEADLGEHADRLVRRPLGMLPGARAWNE